MSLYSGIAKSITKRKTAFNEIHTAYKAAPHQTVGKYVANHKIGAAVGTIGTGADIADMQHHRQSSHQGIQSKVNR